jgi:hypothetical protein
MATPPSGLADIVGDDEDLARFLTQTGHFNAFMAKPAAFMPCPADRETSVFRHGSEPREELWTIGNACARDRNLYGVAIVKTRVVRESQLAVEADEPPPLHAAIRGWPWDETDPDLSKAKRKGIAIAIASKADLLTR